MENSKKSSYTKSSHYKLEEAARRVSSTPVVYEQQALKILDQVQDDKMIKTARAFTLMELLVVVLIIGVLAAVAVPQYKKAVLKSRFIQLKTMAESIVKAEEVYYLANGDYTNQFEDLDIEMSGSDMKLNNVHPGRKADWGECVLFVNSKVHPNSSDKYAFIQCIDQENALGYERFFDWGRPEERGMRKCHDLTRDTTSVQHKLCAAETGTDIYAEDSNGRDLSYAFIYQ